MSIQIGTTSGNYIDRGTIPDERSFSACAWGYQDSDLGNSYESIIGIRTNSYASWVGLYTNGGNFIVSTNGGDTTITTEPGNGVWFFWGLTGNGDTKTGYYRLLTAATLTSNTQTNADFTQQQCRLGGLANGGSEQWDGRFYAVKFWSRAISAQEMMAESMSVTPVSMQGLVGWNPMHRTDATDYRDLSSNGNDLSANGTPNAAGNPGIPWRPAFRTWVTPSAAPPGLAIPIAAHHYKMLASA